jgi:ubiquinone/menaquinone biosynthesis C-methylase UbiE
LVLLFHAVFPVKIKMLVFSKFCWALCCSWLLLLSPSSALINSPFYSYRSPSFDGIGKIYMGREISQVMGHQGANWLERPERVDEEQPQRLVTALALAPDAVVGDIGAGTGYLSQLLAAAVPQGRVLAVDIQPQMIDRLQQKFATTSNVQAVLGQEQSSGLAPASIDVAVMVDAYHEFNYPREMMESVVAALKPHGQIVLAEYRGEDPLVFIKPHHKTTERQMKKELAAVGLSWEKTLAVLPQQHLLFFRKTD